MPFGSVPAKGAYDSPLDDRSRSRLTGDGSFHMPAMGRQVGSGHSPMAAQTRKPTSMPHRKNGRKRRGRKRL